VIIQFKENPIRYTGIGKKMANLIRSGLLSIPEEGLGVINGNMMHRWTAGCNFAVIRTDIKIVYKTSNCVKHLVGYPN
jgi:hypothetical protein